MTVARINGVALHAHDEALTTTELRERAWSELLRQEAVARGLLPTVDTEHMPVLDEREQGVVQAMLDEQVPVQAPSVDEVRRHYEANLERYVEGAQVRARHILFAVTDGVDVTALARRAEAALHELMKPGTAPGRFAELARELSNCPSGAEGGELGWLGAQDLAPELAAELFFQAGAVGHLGLKPRLMHSRYGLHILDVSERLPGRQLPFESVQERVRMLLAHQHRARVLHQYIRVLAGQAQVEGVELEAAASPLLQ